jgi:WD40 repeat protein
MPVDGQDSRQWQLRRGLSPAQIDSIGWNADHTMLCCSSPNGTVHVWKVPSDPEEALTAHNSNGGSPVGISYLQSFIPDAGLRASATVKFTPGLRSLCGFSPDSTRVYNVTSDGKVRTVFAAALFPHSPRSHVFVCRFHNTNLTSPPEFAN